ncbi:hypothetical protein [Pseudomonas sp. R3-56]|uniref:hypothetical protein n=1 Tax=Pseudomonas sp. R3-56 TaxID=2817401 RepID=UPI003DA8F599
MPLILTEARRLTNPTRWLLAQLAAKGGEVWDPIIEVENPITDSELAARGLGDLIANRPSLSPLGPGTVVFPMMV